MPPMWMRLHRYRGARKACSSRRAAWGLKKMRLSKSRPGDRPIQAWDGRGVTVDAAMFATFVRVDGAVESDVRAVVPGDDRAGVFRRKGGAQGRGIGVVARPAVVERQVLLRFVAAGGIRTRASFLGGFHGKEDASLIGTKQEHLFRRGQAVQSGPMTMQVTRRCGQGLAGALGRRFRQAGEARAIPVAGGLDVALRAGELGAEPAVQFGQPVVGDLLVAEGADLNGPASGRARGRPCAPVPVRAAAWRDAAWSRGRWPRSPARRSARR